MKSFHLQCEPGLSRGHLPLIDELKGLALLLVLSYHMGGALGMPNLVHGEIGVDVFLLISGLTLALTSVDLSTGQFLARRFLRIFPSYWLALGLFIWLDAHYYGAHKSWPNLALHAAGLHGFGSGEFFTDINQSFWFISLIVAAYVVFWLLRKRLDDLSLLIGACGALTTVACVAYQSNGHIGGLIHLAIRIPSFFAGLIAGRLLSGGRMEVRINLSLGLGLACFYYLIFFRDITFAYTLAALGFVCTWAALHQLLKKIAAGRALLWAFAALGVISYEVYLFHQPLLRDYSLLFLARSLHILAPTQRQIEVAAFAGLAVAIAFSFGLHHATEWAFRRFRRKKTVEAAMFPARLGDAGVAAPSAKTDGWAARPYPTGSRARPSLAGSR